MILDTSALLAILLREPEAERFALAIQSAPHVRLSVAAYLEAAIHIDRNFDEMGRAMLDSFLEEFQVKVEPVTWKQGQLARQGFRWYGKGRHKAALNFGDCFTWALARDFREPVLYKGNDFAHADIESAI